MRYTFIAALWALAALRPVAAATIVQTFDIGGLYPVLPQEDPVDGAILAEPFTLDPSRLSRVSVNIVGTYIPAVVVTSADGRSPPPAISQARCADLCGIGITGYGFPLLGNLLFDPGYETLLNPGNNLPELLANTPDLFVGSATPVNVTADAPLTPFEARGPSIPLPLLAYFGTSPGIETFEFAPGEYGKQINYSVISPGTVTLTYYYDIDEPPALGLALLVGLVALGLSRSRL